MSEQPKLPQGVLLSGICKGVREEPYNGNLNYYVGFDVETVDRYGQKQAAVEEVSVFGENAEQILTKAKQSVGKHCVMSVIKRAMKSQRTQNAYMRTMIHRNSQLLVIS